jgi:spermidine synthase
VAREAASLTGMIALRFGFLALAALVLAASGALADGPVDDAVRAQMLKRRDGPVAHLETEYNDLFIAKQGRLMALSTRYKARDNIDSIVDLGDPDEMVAPYTRIMSVGLLYPETTRRVLMIGLGAGSVSTYLARAMPDLTIDVIDLDRGVIDAAKKYFGLRETGNLHFIESDGRVYLTRHKELYDLILLDAYRELGVPFHLLTKEFYALVKEHLSPGGAVASNITGGTKLYASTLATFRAVFPTVDVYPEYEGPEEAQVVIVAAAEPPPTTESLRPRAAALQERYRFRYPLPNLLMGRITDRTVANGELLTDDFAPVNLYEVAPIKPRRRP